ncbi:hypothetical protein PINS_up004033 [Pythium insidiosum]|nr:hypothetical protein PINS_up004033 [Pythium insidiosum]
MKKFGEFLGSNKVADTRASRSWRSVRERGGSIGLKRKSGRVGPILSSSERMDTARDSRNLREVVEDNARALVKHIPTVRRLIRDAPLTPSGRALAKRTSNRRIRRRPFHFVPSAQTEEQLNLRWVIKPRAPWKVRWDLWIGFIICYSVIVIPYRIGFAVEPAKWESILNWGFDASFGVDIILNFFTGYYDEDTFVYDLSKIRSRYFRSWFIFDALSTFPFDNLFQVSDGTDPSLLSIKLFRTVRLVRLLKLMRLLRLRRAVASVQMDALNAHVLQTLRSLTMIIFIIHLLSCAWYMFYTWDPLGLNWVTYMSDDGISYPYLVCFYWVANTMMSVGYGDIYGITDGERAFSVFVECVGSVCVGLIIANIQMLTENYNPRGVAMGLKLQETKEFLHKRLIPRRLRQRVVSQFEYHWSHRTVFDEDKLLHQFPESLQYEILAASMEGFVQRFPFFGVTTVEFFVFIIPRLRPIVVGPGQTLVEAESVWEEIYFIISGSMEVMRGNSIAASLTSGDICGIEYLVGERRRYHHTFRSNAKTEVYALYSADLVMSLPKCPVASKFLHDLAHLIAERYADAARKGKRALQKQEQTVRRASLELFVQYRHRRSTSHNNVLQGAAEAQLPTEKVQNGSIEEGGLHWSVIRHYSRGRIFWDTCMAVIVAWTAISVPFRISFDVDDTMFLSATDRSSDVLFFFDTVLNFFTTYIDDTGVEIVDPHEIRRHYLRTSFIVDLASMIPFDFIVETVTATPKFRSLKLIRTVKLVKLLRLVRISRLLKMNAQWISELDVSTDSIRLMRLLVPVMTIGHYVGCFWYYISADAEPKDAWWGRIHFDNPKSLISRYIASVYWATTTMTTVGFGDIFAVNEVELMYSIIVMIGGTTLFAYVIGTVIEIVSNSTSLTNREHELGQRVNAYIKERGVSKEFVNACQEHLRYVNNEKTLFHEQGLFDALSHSLRGELTLYLNANVLAQIRFFDKKPKWFLTLLLPRLVPQYFLSGDLLIYHGNLVYGIFFLMSGTVTARVPQPSDLAQNDHKAAEHKRTIKMATNGRTMDAVPDHDGTIATLYEGEFFGYKEVLTRTVAQYNVFACRPTGVYVLPRSCLDHIHDVFPDVYEEMRGLFLHSINKQQTILHHWHKNEIMGLSEHERDFVLRRMRRGDEPYSAMHGISSSSSGRATPASGNSTRSFVSGHVAPILDKDPADLEEEIDEGKATDAVSELPQFPAVRRSSILQLAEGAGTLLQQTTTVDRHVNRQAESKINDQPLATRDGEPVPPRPRSFVKMPPQSEAKGQRRSSFILPQRAPPSERPPLRRYPSVPEEIDALVGRLLEVEGYVTPRLSIMKSQHSVPSSIASSQEHDTTDL